MINPEQGIANPTKIQQIYKQRVNDFFAQVETWLPDELETVIISNEHLIEDETGRYAVTSISIVKKDTSEPDDVVASLLPQGVSVLLADGLIELNGPFATESILYMQKDSLIIHDSAGKERKMFGGLKQDGWHWLGNENPVPALLLDADLFMKLLAIVSDYESAQSFTSILE